MKKIKSMLESIFEHLKNTAERYPVTLTLIMLTSVFAAVFIDQSGRFAQFMENQGLAFTFLWGIGTYFAETCLTGKRPAKWAGIIAAGLIAAGLVYSVNYGSETFKETGGHLTWAYCIILIALGVYRNFRDSAVPFNAYCLRVVHGLSRLAIICAVTAAGLALVTAVFVALILNGKHYMLVFRAEFLVMGCLTGSGLLTALIAPDRERSRFFTVIVRYLLTGLLTAAFVIIYGYILKIIITRVVPSNEIFRILAGLFIIGLPIWTLAGTYEENDPLIRISILMPYLFIPFLFLQGYAIRERIAAYGLTPMRYLCLILMLYEVTYIIVYALRKRETGIMLPVIAVLAAVSLVIPYVNMYSTSNRSQKAIFDRYITADFSALSREDQSSLAGAYYYLTGNPKGKAMIADTDPQKIEAIRDSGLIGQSDYDQNIYIFHEFPLINEDISEYGSVSAIATRSSAGEQVKPDVYDPAEVVFYNPDGTPVLTADLRGFINDCIAEAEGSGTWEISAAIRIGEGQLLRLTDCSIVVGTDGVISYLSMNGLLLEK